MFNVEGTTITISKGDTGAILFTANATRKDTGAPYTFGERDRALFSIKQGDRVIKRKCYSLKNNMFTVVFFNADTDQLANGTYNWDVRYVINPYYGEDPPEGPWPNYEDLVFPVTIGQKCMHEGTYYMANQAIISSEAWNIDHWTCVDGRIPVDGDQVITPNQPMNMTILNVVSEI